MSVVWITLVYLIVQFCCLFLSVVVVRFTQGQFEGQEGDLTIPISVELDPTSGTVVFDTDVTVQSFALTSTATCEE